MKQNNLTRACVLGGLLAGTQIAPAFTADNPYLTTITNRNLFKLLAPPDPASLIPVVAAPPLPNVLLAGITTLMGNTRAVLRVPRAARPPEPAKEISLFLSAGGPAEEGVRVLEINVAAGTVKIENNGTVQDLDITKNAPKSAAAPPPVPMPPPQPGVGGPVPPPAPAVTSNVRPVRSSGTVIGSGPGQLGNPANDAVQPVSAEVAAIVFESWRMRDQDQINAHIMPPYPKTELSEALEQEQQQQQEQGGSGPPVPKF